jgi:hypothetical protein
MTPRVLLITDVPVELKSAGSTLLYRLFQNYPADCLMILQYNSPDTRRRLDDVEYRSYSVPFADRLRITRFNLLGMQIEYIHSLAFGRKIMDLISEFRPNVLVSVVFRFAWLKAYKVSKQTGIPLYLILHDDILTGEIHNKLFRKVVKFDLGKAYRHSKSRFCISPIMEEYYYNEFGVHGSVMYPFYSPDHLFAVEFPTGVKRSNLTFCYAGSVFTPDFLPMLDKLAAYLKKHNSKLVIFSEIDKSLIIEFKHLNESHVDIMDLIDPEDLKQYMLDNIDVNVLLNSFLYEEAFRYNFSSKLVDYSLSGLPVFIWGSKSSGAISWAMDFGYPCLIQQDDIALEKYLSIFFDSTMRNTLAMKFYQVSKKTFDYEKNTNEFFQELAS